MSPLTATPTRVSRFTRPTATSGQGSWQVVGGTSLGAPAWAGFIAIVDQGRALAGEGSLDGPTQPLPALYAASATDFNTVSGTSVSSLIGRRTRPVGGFDPFGSGHHRSRPPCRRSAGATANTSTGLGSPIGAVAHQRPGDQHSHQAVDIVDGASNAGRHPADQAGQEPREAPQDPRPYHAQDEVALRGPAKRKNVAEGGSKVAERRPGVHARKP